LILEVWGGLPSAGIVIGGEVFLCMTESVFEAGQYLRRVECGIDGHVVSTRPEAGMFPTTKGGGTLPPPFRYWILNPTDC